MANYANTTFTTAVVKATKFFQDLENREPEYGGFRSFLQNPSQFEAIQRLALARQKPTSYQMKTFSPGTGSGSLTCNPTATSGDTADTALAFSTITGEMVISSKRQSTNLKTTQEQAEEDLKEMLAGMYEDMEEAAMSYLNTNRSQYDISLEGGSTWMPTTDFYNKIAYADSDNFVQIIKSEMRKQKYRDMLNVVYTGTYDRILENTIIQGMGNARNLEDAKAIIKKMNIFYTNEDIAVTDTYGGVFITPMGGTAVIPWIDEMYRQPTPKIQGDTEWGHIIDPVFGLKIAYLRKFSCADTTGIGGAAQDAVESYQFHIDLAFTHAAVTDPALETPIHKYALAKA